MKVKIGNLTKIRTGKLDANASSEDGQYPFFTCSREPLRISTYSYDCECVLVAGNGDLNVKYYNGKFDAYQRTYIIEDNGSGKLFMPYLYYFMEGYIEELRKQAIGGVIKYIKLGNLTDALIELPSVDEQKAIVDILEKAKNVLDMRNEEISKLDNLIKARFVEMFGDPTDVSLERVSLAEYVKNTKYGTSQPPQFDLEGCYKFIRATNIKNGHIVEKDMLRISKDEADKISKCKLNGGELIIVRSGANTGDTCVITDDYVGQYAGYDIIISLKINLINPIYLNELINIPRYMRTVVKPLTARSAQPHLNTQQVQSLPIIVANIERQNQFAEFVKQVDKSKFIHINIIFGRRV